MQKMAVFPMELLRMVIKNVDTKEVFRLRGINTAFQAIATPLAFETLHVSRTVERFNAIAELQDCASIAKHVKKLIFTDDDDHWGSRITERRSKHMYTLMMAIPRVFARLAKFSALESLTLQFSPHFSGYDDSPQGEHPHFQRAVLELVTRSAHPPLLTSLSLLNLIATDGTVYGEEGFYNLLGPLKSLSMIILHQKAHGCYSDPALVTFWSRTMPRILTLPSLFHLTSLALDGGLYIGEAPYVKWEDIYFPNLSSLSMANFLFGAASDTEGFVLKHKATLRYLELHTCDILVRPNHESTCLWSGLLANFERELIHLDNFVILGWPNNCRALGSNPGLSNGLHYVFFREGLGCSSFSHKNGEDDDDGPALERLLVTIQARSVCLFTN